MAVTHHSICHSQNPTIHANLTALSFIEPELWVIKVLHCRNREFRLFLLPWPWPWPSDLHIWIWPIFPGDTTDVQIRTSSRLPKVIIWHIYIQTDTTEITYHAAAWVVNHTHFLTKYVKIRQWTNIYIYIYGLHIWLLVLNYTF